jgi:ribose transport system substrate-binding protein
MNKLNKTIIFLIIIAFLGAFAFSMYYFQHVDNVFLNKDNGKPINETKADYHFVLIVQNTDDPFWQSFKKGAFEAAKDFNAAVEFNGPKFTNVAEELQYLDIAIASKVDGIATHVLDEEQFTPVIDKAIGAGVPVVTVEADAKNSKRIAYIGTSNFQLGVEGGKLLTKAVNSRAQVAVVLNSYGNDAGNVMQNLKIAGLMEAIKTSGKDINIKTIQTSQMGILSAGEITNDIINKYPDVNVIFCTSSEDTIGAAQVVVDLNRVGNITIIGYGDLPEILNYVDKGVISGTVVSNPVEMGYQSIKSLVEIKKKNRTSDYVDTGVQGVSKANLAEYLKMVEDKKGKDSSK